MKTQIYTLRDAVLGSYSPPFFAFNADHAKRICSDVVKAPGTDLYAHPEDFDLFLLGVFNDEDACIELEHAPLKMLNLSSFRPTQEILNGDSK